VVQTDSALIERLVARGVGELIESHQCLAKQPDDVSKRSSVLVEDRVAAEQGSVSGNTAVKIAYRQRAVNDRGKFGHVILLEGQQSPVGAQTRFKDTSGSECHTGAGDWSGAVVAPLPYVWSARCGPCSSAYVLLPLLAGCSSTSSISSTVSLP
jgi:hypothetical protein